MVSSDSKSILLVVTGGIASYKSATLASRLVQAGHDVRVVMTNSASQFIGEATFRALTGKPVVKDLFDPGFTLGAHIELARDNELMIIAPATANFLAKAANGLSDDLVSTLYLCFTQSVWVAPAMNVEMWNQPSVQRNVAQLKDDGVHFVDPQEGWLSCRTKGVGRMAEPESIIEQVLGSGS